MTNPKLLLQELHWVLRRAWDERTLPASVVPADLVRRIEACLTDEPCEQHQVHADSAPKGNAETGRLILEAAGIDPSRLFASQAQPDTRSLTHQEIFSAVYHHAKEITRLTEVVPAQCAEESLAEPAERPCTCHPDDNPPRPCPRKYALSECRKAAAYREQVNSLALECAESTRRAAVKSSVQHPVTITGRCGDPDCAYCASRTNEQ